MFFIFFTITVFFTIILTNQDKIIKISINNLEQTLKNHKRDSFLESSITGHLKSIVIKNLDNVHHPKKLTATIRNDSFSQIKKSNSNHFNTTFLVDIPAIKQTYRISYPILNLKENEYNGSELSIKCPQKEDLIYPDFKCGDLYNEKGYDRDPIFQITPAYRNANGFIITAKRNSPGQKPTITIDILTDLEFEKEGIKSLALKYLTDRDIKLENYEIIYTYPK